MSNMLDRSDHDELLPDCPWNKEDAEYCDAHDSELDYGEDEDGREIRFCKLCNEVAEELMGVTDVVDMWKSTNEGSEENGNG